MRPHGNRIDAPPALLAVLAGYSLLVFFAGCLNQKRVIVEVPTTEVRSNPVIPAARVLPSVAGDFALLLEADRDVESRSWESVVLHHSGGSSGNVATIDADHRRRTDSNGRPWRGIGYHFVIGNGQGMEDGRVEATFRWRKQLAGAHAGVRQYNESGIGICLIGDFNRTSPSPRQIESCQALVAQLCQTYGLARDEILRHSDFKATQCPGQLFPFSRICQGVPARVEAAGTSLDYDFRN